MANEKRLSYPFILIIVCLFFVVFSFTPSIFEIVKSKTLPPMREFVLEHNYMFDFNFYLSRIRQGMEGRWLVVEKYYNKPHTGSLFQILYLYLGKIGSMLSLGPTAVYHLTRLVFGFSLLYYTGRKLIKIFSSFWWIIAFLLIVTGGSWPILVDAGGFPRFATHMGWWSVVDSLQRITFMPHILFGQLFMFIFIWRYSRKKLLDNFLSMLIWGVVGFVVGIVFPPTNVLVYTYIGLISIWEFFSLGISGHFKGFKSIVKWLKNTGLSRISFVLLSFPSFVYLQLMFKVWPWKALALFDVHHRMALPYKDYFLSLGPMLPLGILGGVIILINKKEKFLPFVFWIISIFLLFFIFENIPQQSPLRFTEAAIHVPLGVLAGYLFYYLWNKLSKLKEKTKVAAVSLKVLLGSVMSLVILIGLGVMLSMIGWLTDQKRAKAWATIPVPTGAQLVYPLKDFMRAIYFLRDNTKVNEIVFSYETAGNYIPAYSGNFVYMGHANTPNERERKLTSWQFFSGEMKESAVDFLKQENISYIYFGPQEFQLSGGRELTDLYPQLENLIEEKYRNDQVIIYQVK